MAANRGVPGRLPQPGAYSGLMNQLFHVFLPAGELENQQWLWECWAWLGELIKNRNVDFWPLPYISAAAVSRMALKAAGSGSDWTGPDWTAGRRAAGAP